MPTQARRLLVTRLALGLLLSASTSARAAAPASESQAQAIGPTPPRLSYTDGEVSFWRPGAPDWAPAQVNTPLAPGDELFTGAQGDLETQVGARAFVRAWGATHLGITNLTLDFLQLKVPGGHVSLDLRSLDPGRIVELDTPHAAFTIEHPGYYRADVTQERTSFITQRGGQATMTPAGGQAAAIAPSEEVVLEGAPTSSVQSYVAPELDAWDQWNYSRTEHLLDAVSARYTPSEVYGVDDLDHYGNWRVVQPYGPVWVPEGLPATWGPYSTGTWIWDPYYGWTWVDTALWGWAPYHYGRWVSVDGFWAWAPGPMARRTVYAPALVAFFGLSGVPVGLGGRLVSWVALGWGEPLVPWWGRPGFVGRPSWAGWGGAHVGAAVHTNVSVQSAVVTVSQDHFGRRSVQEARIAQVDPHRLEPVRGPLRARPDASSFVAVSGHTVRPSEPTLGRPVVATRPPAARSGSPRAETRQTAPVVSVPAPRIVATPTAASAGPALPRPAFGTSALERARRPGPPRFEGSQPPTPAGERRESAQAVPQQPQHSATRALPGEPANRLFPGRSAAGSRHPS